MDDGAYGLYTFSKEAITYIERMRSISKRRYARAYLRYLISPYFGQPECPPWLSEASLNKLRRDLSNMVEGAE